MEGKKNIIFSVSKVELLKKIATNSYYRGERAKDDAGALAARMQSGEDNNDILTDELGLAAADVVVMITRNLGRCAMQIYENLIVDVYGETWELEKRDGDNYSRKSDGANIYVSGDIVVGSKVDLRDTGMQMMYEGTVIGNSSYNFEVLAASNFPETLTKSVEGAISSYMFDKALEGWMLINMPNEVESLGQRGVVDAERLRQLLVERTKPIR